jgi:selenocysteine lyase/cysteine desulfurase
VKRRDFLHGLGGLAAGMAGGCGWPGGGAGIGAGVAGGSGAVELDPSDWSSVRAQFAVAERPIDLSALYISSHPRPVRDAIARHRDGLDREPTLYLMRHNVGRTNEAIRAAARWLGGSTDDVALTDSTTMGLGILYNGLDLSPGDEVLTTEHDYYVTHESVRQAAEGSGAEVRRIALYDELPGESAQEIVGRIVSQVSPRTRVLALTWVHSGTGLKLPLAEIARAVRALDDGRDDEDRILICVDGVHGFGVEDAGVDDLDCDFFAAGTHKWVFGPRGTGILWGRGARWSRVRPLVPSFLDDASWAAWSAEDDPAGRTDGERMTPGGFKPYEHRWAMAEAFGFLEAIGRERIAERTHSLARRLKEGLASIDGVRVVTPMSKALSSGIVCCDLRGWSAGAAVSALRDRGIVATVTPYAVEYVRFSPSIRNSEEDVDAAVEAVRELV